MLKGLMLEFIYCSVQGRLDPRPIIAPGPEKWLHHDDVDGCFGRSVLEAEAVIRVRVRFCAVNYDAACCFVPVAGRGVAETEDAAAAGAAA